MKTKIDNTDIDSWRHVTKPNGNDHSELAALHLQRPALCKSNFLQIFEKQERKLNKR